MIRRVINGIEVVETIKPVTCGDEGMIYARFFLPCHCVRESVMESSDLGRIGAADRAGGLRPEPQASQPVGAHPLRGDIQDALDEAMRRYRAMTPEQQDEMWKAQRESWVRAFAACEHGDPDWETCPGCLQQFADRRAALAIDARSGATAGRDPKGESAGPKDNAQGEVSHGQGNQG